MARTVIATDKAPGAVGPYVQAIRAGNLVFCSGQLGIEPASGKLVGGDVAAEARQALANITAVLAAAGATLGDVVKTVIYLTTMDDFTTVNQVYADVMGEQLPARTTIAVAGLPRGARVEIDVTASLG